MSKTTRIEDALNEARDVLADPEKAAGTHGERLADEIQDLMKGERPFFAALNKWREVAPSARRRVHEALEALSVIEDSYGALAAANELLNNADDLS